ncbi:hypothetical protein ACS0TY_004920 [Phlomoides rotata]
MSIQSPFKLEINIISAHDLPPVSKMLRTFAVAYIHPDQKLTTKIDHNGHTNPAWNYKVLFHVDEKFLKQESSAITFEIYNLAWLRDLPIGTARLSIGHLSPPLIKNPGFRRVAIKITRPSGHLQGTLNLGVQLVENTLNNDSGDQALCLFNSLRDVELNEDEDEKEEEDDEVKEKYNNFQDQGKNPGPEINSRPGLIKSRPDSVSQTPESKYTNLPGSEHETNASFFSTMKPLPSEVADDLKKGVYATEWTDYGSSVFENWTEHGDNKSDGQPEWPVMTKEDLIPLTMSDKRSDCRSCTKRSEKKKGLFSCFFGKRYGFEFSIICGSNELKKKKKNRNVNMQNVHLMTMPQEDFRKFYV